jgi:hypothetical protein
MNTEGLIYIALYMNDMFCPCCFASESGQATLKKLLFPNFILGIVRYLSFIYQPNF